MTDQPRMGNSHDFVGGSGGRNKNNGHATPAVRRCQPEKVTSIG